MEKEGGKNERDFFPILRKRRVTGKPMNRGHLPFFFRGDLPYGVKGKKGGGYWSHVGKWGGGGSLGLFRFKGRTYDEKEFRKKRGKVAQAVGQTIRKKVEEKTEWEKNRSWAGEQGRERGPSFFDI